MSMMTDIEQFLRNIEAYKNKNTVKQHLSAFAKEFRMFHAQTTVSQYQENVFSFIELKGKVVLCKTVVDILCMIPYDYPDAPPIFVILLNNESLKENLAHPAFAKNVLKVEQTQGNQNYIRLLFPFMTNQWHTTSKNILASYRRVIETITNPCLLVLEQNKKAQKFNYSKNCEDWLLNVLNQKRNQIGVINSLETIVDQSREKQFYFKSRNHFVKENLAQTLNALQSTYQKAVLQTEIYQQKMQSLQNNQTLNTLFNMNEKNRKKLSALSEKSALEEFESKYIKDLQDKLIKKEIDFQKENEFWLQKKQMRKIFERMFINRLLYLHESE